MRRSLIPWVWSTGGLSAGMAATAATSWTLARQGHDIGEVGHSILTSTFPDELIPRLLIAAVFVWGGYLLLRAASRRQVLAAAMTCAIIGTFVALYVVVRAEIGFAQAFPNDGVVRGWAPGAARAEFMPLPYLVASVQAVFGFLASTVLLAICGFRRSPV